MFLEFVFLCVALQLKCGSRYFLNMIVTFIAYTLFTNSYSEQRIKQIRDKKQIDKRQEFYQNESIQNYETVKQFNNEGLEKGRYSKILDKMVDQAMVVQKSLSSLNIGQQAIFNAGLTLNLALAAVDVYSGKMTPGDFVLVQSLFMQLAGPLFNLGTFLRQLEETSVDVEDLYHNINSKPLVTEKPDAKDFEYKEGKIKFENIDFKHYQYDDNQLRKKQAKPETEGDE